MTIERKYDCPLCGKPNTCISTNINFGSGPPCYVVEECSDCKRKAQR